MKRLGAVGGAHMTVRMDIAMAIHSIMREEGIPYSQADTGTADRINDLLGLPTDVDDIMVAVNEAPDMVFQPVQGFKGVVKFNQTMRWLESHLKIMKQHKHQMRLMA